MGPVEADGTQVHWPEMQPLSAIRRSELQEEYLNFLSSKGKGKSRPSQDYGPASESSEEDALETIQEEYPFEGWPSAMHKDHSSMSAAVSDDIQHP